MVEIEIKIEIKNLAVCKDGEVFFGLKSSDFIDQFLAANTNPETALTAMATFFDTPSAVIDVKLSDIMRDPDAAAKQKQSAAHFYEEEPPILLSECCYEYHVFLTKKNLRIRKGTEVFS